jgi:hypothetical protein
MKPMTEGVLRELIDYLARAKAAEEACDLAIAERDEAYRQRDVQASRVLGMGSMLDDIRTILGATDGETLSEAARRHANPAQTFHPPISVTLVSGPDLGHPCAQVKVGLVGDPAFLALSGSDYARLALVVTRG